MQDGSEYGCKRCGVVHAFLDPCPVTATVLGMPFRVDPEMPKDRVRFVHPDGRSDEFWTCCVMRTSGPHAPGCDRRPRLVREPAGTGPGRGAMAEQPVSKGSEK